MSEVKDKILKILSDKNIAINERLQSEIDELENKNILEHVYLKYKKIQGDFEVGDVNHINSLLCYVLGTTTKEPDISKSMNIDLRRTYGRSGFPDVDMDFDYERRSEVLNYLVEKYGRENVGNIGVKQTLKTKMAVRRAVKILDPENNIIFDKDGNKIKNDVSENIKLENTILSTLPRLSPMKKSDGTLIESIEDACKEFPDFNRYMEQYPEVKRVACKIEGSIASFGCVSADSPILTDSGWIRIDQLDSSCKIAYLNRGGEINYSSNYFNHMTSNKMLYKINLENGDSVKITDDHIMFTDKGCIKFENIRKNPEEYRILSIKN